MKRYAKKTRGAGEKKKLWPYLLLITGAAALLFFGNRLAVRGAELFTGGGSDGIGASYPVSVDVILSTNEDKVALAGDESYDAMTTTFLGTVISGGKKGEVLHCRQDIDTTSLGYSTVVKQGDRVFVTQTTLESDGWYSMTNFYRTDKIALIAGLFCALLLVFGGMKGVTALVSLAYSMLTVFLFFVPAILSGFNVYLCTVLVAAANILFTPFLIGGFDRKGLAAAAGCLTGVGVAAAAALLLNNLFRISGITDEEMLYLSFLSQEHPLDLNGIIFSMVLIGALGATIDVSMSIASPVFELRDRGASFGTLLSSGLNIGRDIMGAQTSTLVFAYIGSSLSTVLLLVTFQSSFMEMMNAEMVVAELTETLVGAFAILATIPATALISALMAKGGRASGGEFSA